MPFSTLNVGRIRGGTAVNIIPNECELQFDYRNLPTMNTDAVLLPLKAYVQELIQEMQQVHGDATIVLKQMEQVPAMQSEEGNALYSLIEGLVDEHKRSKVAYATEGGHFQLADMHAVICGPGSIAQAHKADEYIELTQLARCDRFLQQLLHTQSIKN